PDKDTFIGDEDKCPDQPETWNGYQDDDGCPDTPPGKATPLVTVKEGKRGSTLEVSRPIAFLPSGEVEAQSLLTLRAVASVLLRPPSFQLSVGVRPSPRNGGEPMAEVRTRAVVAALRRYVRREQAAEAAPWAAVKDAPRAAEHGVGFLLVTPRK